MVIQAVFKDGVFEPLNAIDLPEGRQVEVVIRNETTKSSSGLTGNLPEETALEHRLTEAELLEEINQGISAVEWNRYHVLIAKRQHDMLSDDELKELILLSDRIDALNVRRMETLAELARLRGTTLPALLEQLGLTPPQVI